MISSRPLLSIIVIFHNMQRESERTLFSLSREYQFESTHLRYEVIAIDNNSNESLSSDNVKKFGNNFTYHFYKTNSISPVDAINFGVDISKGKNLMVIIDGARILSPGIFKSTADILRLCQTPFIYTLGLHLGPKIQNQSILEGYNQNEEDKLLKSINWRKNGYQLNKISSLAGSSSQGYFGKITESNCFIVPKKVYKEVGGMNPAFQTAGGGLVNLDFFKKIHASNKITPFMLLAKVHSIKYTGV